MSDDEEQIFSKSKSQLKREMLELQELGKRLVGLSKERLSKLDLPSSLLSAIEEAKRLNSRGGIRRQLQYIGRLMRDLEAPERIREYFQRLEMKDERAAAFFHMLESWRERLICDESLETTTEFITQYPEIDRQYFRQLIQNAKKERKQGKPAGAGKALFRYLRELQGNNNNNTEDLS